MTHANVLIRPAVDRELDDVRALLAETWHATFDTLIGAEIVTEITARWHAPMALLRQLRDADTSFLVAELEGHLVAHLCATFQPPSMLMVGRLYVLPEFQRRGIGSQLLTAAAERHPQATELRLIVHAGNANALAFYRQQDFAVYEELDTEGIPELRLRKILR